MGSPGRPGGGGWGGGRAVVVAGGSGGGGGWSGGRWWRLLGRAAGHAAGRRDGHGEADADEEALLGRVGQAGHDADDLAVPVEQRPTRVAGVDGRVELDEARERAATADRS